MCSVQFSMEIVRLKFTGLLLAVLLTGFSCSHSQTSVRNHTTVVERINDLMTSYYVFPDIARETAAHLNACLDAGLFDQISSTEELADRLTAEVQSVNHDKHMRVFPKDRSRNNAYHRPANGGFANAEILDTSIGYIDMRAFVDIRYGVPAADSIMQMVANTDALIIDLRKNGGGSPEMVQYLCSYFFTERTHLNSLYWRQGNRTQEFWTLENVNGEKRPEIPLYILTSSYTFSGAEEFCYNMQTRERAMLIGETTGGGANPG
ncbi:MAG: S41 family peptidase, partial [Cyclobacteriaceae bacterium]